MSNCQKCGCTTQNGRRWCDICSVEETAPDLTTDDDHECPHCGGRTSGEGVTCADCRRVGHVLNKDMDGKTADEVSD